ncbi:hypothetical protein [Acinetobacter sp. BMW17]|uniref:hypothetical protein n=1 Tax=Acinetobacter sp. BMW17 TaxID=1795629 RepID=UPI000781C3E3|nr:hypothetical protein [Acinetobacter sp. BMW17]
MPKTLKGIVVGLFMFNGLSSAMAEQSINSVPHVQQLAQQVEAELHGTDPLLRYHAYKAKMWLSYAKSEISVQGLSSAGQEALQQAQILVDGFNQPTQLSLTTPVLSMAQVMRRDLWVQLEYLKRQGAILVAPERLAQAEVTLVWAAVEYCELGWRHAREHFQAAERTIFQVQQQLPYVVMTSDAFDLPTLVQLNGHGCQGVNAQYWPLLNTAQIQVPSSRSSEGNQK